MASGLAARINDMALRKILEMECTMSLEDALTFPALYPTRILRSCGNTEGEPRLCSAQAALEGLTLAILPKLIFSAIRLSAIFLAGIQRDGARRFVSSPCGLCHGSGHRGFVQEARGGPASSPVSPVARAQLDERSQWPDLLARTLPHVSSIQSAVGGMGKHELGTRNQSGHDPMAA